MKKILSIILALIMSSSILTGCGDNKNINESPVNQSNTQSSEPPVIGGNITPTDYSKPEHWLNIPDTDYEVDIFYLYPTTWTRNEGEPYVCEIDNESMMAGVKPIYSGQATAFETVGNVYAPYYRQVDAVWVLKDSLLEGEKYFGGVPYTDAAAAFEYYLEHYNNGKPFILAGHSQGSAVTKAIVKYYMAEHPEVYEKMIAAYVIGYFVTEDELKEYPHMKFAESADDTGVIVSWNVEAPGTTDNPLAPKGSISINPISWTRGEDLASAELNLGSEIFSRTEPHLTHMDKFADAKVNLERGTVICSTADVDTLAPGALFPRGVYHSQDYGFYYHNIRENAKNRAEKFLCK